MTKTRDLSDFLIEGGADLPLQDAHIIPGTLYPSYVASGTSNKLLDGTTDHSGAFGTEQSDGRKYYYTNIAGSKPIKDPRIGAYFGSQRHKTKSIQILEQETATHGDDVYSIDGREWMRGVGDIIQANFSRGAMIRLGFPESSAAAGSFIEVTGYFNAVNLLNFNEDARAGLDYYIDGTVTQTNDTQFTTTVTSPLDGRYVDAQAIHTINVGTINTPGIHTLKMVINVTSNTGSSQISAIELIAQDITSTANRSKIQIPAQNVVSFGKKFSITATADHYDPFSAKTDGSAWTSPTSGNNTANSAASWPTNIDTAHSLGLENWVNGSSYYRPYNGGRVVKYVDSTGSIKTAVTVMPPNARSIANANNLSGGAEKGDDSAGNTSAAVANSNYQPTFTDQTIATAEELHEVAKTFHWREFGNGAANGGTGAGGNKADASMLNTADDISFIMDDGLTGLVADDALIQSISGKPNTLSWTGSVAKFLTFIGTGISVTGATNATNEETKHLAQNLPYGTHILKAQQGTDYATIDGINLGQTSADAGHYWKEVTFYQPKRPPIPEDAVVLTDYMLMADFVPQSAVGTEKVSKGTRILSISRDVFFSGGSVNFALYPAYSEGFYAYSNTNGYLQKLPFFGSGVIKRYEGNTSNGATLGFTNDGTNFSGGTFFGSASSNQLVQSAAAGNGRFGGIHSLDVGVYTSKLALTSTNYFRGNGYEIITPIHTSHHYQSFETPFLHELVGGDRNMEQTNLICSPDGKTWDEITRDTSYLGSNLVAARVEGGSTGGFLYQDNIVIWDEWRGVNDQLNCGNKDWAIAYDHMICLKDGEYTITAVILHGSSDRTRLVVNGSDLVMLHETGYNDTGTIHVTQSFKRGDYVHIYDGAYEQLYSHFQITKA